jgi:FkbM family methyltransferase
MKNSMELIDSYKRFVLERTPWILRFLPVLRGKGIQLKFTNDHIAVIDRISRRQIWINRANAAYVPDMVSSFDYYFGAVEPFKQPSSVGGYWVVDYSSPRIHQVTGFADFPVLCPSLVEAYQTCEQYLEFAQLKEGQTVFDLGCYSGLTAIAFSKAVKERGRVISVEPDPSNFAASSLNIGLHGRVNGLKNITLLKLAVSGNNGTLKFSSEGSMGSSAVSIVGGYRGTVMKVPCVTLEDLAKQSGVEHVDFIKMDIEGSELDVIHNGKAFIQKHRPKLIIEPHVVNGNLNADELISCLSGYGYRCDMIEQLGVSLPLVTAIPT